MAAIDLLSLFETYKAAVAKKDLAGLMSIYDDSIYAFDAWNVWLIESLEAWRGMNEQWFASLGQDHDVVEFAEVRTDASGVIGYATAIATFSAVSAEGAVLRSLQNRLTWIARRRVEGWRIVHQHTSMPIDHNAKAILNR